MCCLSDFFKHILKKKGRAFRNIGKEKYISLTVKSALLLYYLLAIFTDQTYVDVENKNDRLRYGILGDPGAVSEAEDKVKTGGKKFDKQFVFGPTYVTNCPWVSEDGDMETSADRMHSG